MASSKVKNNLFVWGESSLTATDLAAVETNQFNKGFVGGEGIYADILNSALRSPTLLTSALIDVLKEGPNLTFNNINKTYTSNWDDAFPAGGYDFKYSINDTDYSTFVANLKKVIDQYLAYSQVQHALNANALTNIRKLRTVDTASTPNKSTQVNFDGTSDVEIPLPATIHATVDGNASSATNVTNQINGKNITDIFESDGTRVKRATDSSYAARIGYSNSPTTQGDKYTPIYLYNGNFQKCYQTARYFRGPGLGSNSYIVYLSKSGSATATKKLGAVQYLTTPSSTIVVNSIVCYGVFSTSADPTNAGYGRGNISFTITHDTIGQYITFSEVRALKITTADILQTIPGLSVTHSFAITSINVYFEFDTPNNQKDNQDYWFALNGADEIYICCRTADKSVLRIDVKLEGIFSPN